MSAIDRLIKMVHGTTQTSQGAYVQPGTYAPGEVPGYAFCEPVYASASGRWHIRKVEGRLYLGGGIDTPSLCGKVKPFGPEYGALGGWDLNVKITEHHLGHCCPDCVKAYQEAVSGNSK